MQTHRHTKQSGGDHKENIEEYICCLYFCLVWCLSSRGGFIFPGIFVLVKSPLNLGRFLFIYKEIQLYFTLLFLCWAKWWAVWPPGKTLMFPDFGWILFCIKLRLQASISKWSRKTSDWQKVVPLWCCHKMIKKKEIIIKLHFHYGAIDLNDFSPNMVYTITAVHLVTYLVSLF